MHVIQDKVLRDVHATLRKRVFHLVKHPATLSALRNARKAAAEAGPSTYDAAGRISCIVAAIHVLMGS